MEIHAGKSLQPRYYHPSLDVQTNKFRKTIRRLANRQVHTKLLRCVAKNVNLRIVSFDAAITS